MIIVIIIIIIIIIVSSNSSSSSNSNGSFSTIIKYRAGLCRIQCMLGATNCCTWPAALLQIETFAHGERQGAR